MDVELDSDTSGYVSFGEGWVGRFELPGDGRPLRVERVASELRYPRGLALLGDRLFVSELGRLPCTPSFPSCKGGDVEGQSVEETEREILRTSRARVLAFEIEPDGALSHPRSVLDDLPVANSDHGVNDVEPGPDGRLYVAVGNLDRLYATPRLAPDLARPNAELLGTVVSMRPDGSDRMVVASGLRNVYGLAFDPHGRLFGSDNDGPTRSGWRREEVLQLREGADYGYPDDGTFAPETRPRAPALTVLDAVGTGGIGWIDGEDVGQLVVGACSSVDRIRLGETPDGEPTVASRGDVTRLLELPGCVTTIALRGDELLLGVFTFVGTPQLLRIELDR
jgi:glucose/arabinose dehydrogenase